MGSSIAVKQPIEQDILQEIIEEVDAYQVHLANLYMTINMMLRIAARERRRVHTLTSAQSARNCTNRVKKPLIVVLNKINSCLRTTYCRKAWFIS